MKTPFVPFTTGSHNDTYPAIKHNRAEFSTSGKSVVVTIGGS